MPHGQNRVGTAVNRGFRSTDTRKQYVNPDIGNRQFAGIAKNVTARNKHVLRKSRTRQAEHQGTYLRWSLRTSAKRWVSDENVQ